MNHQVRTMPVQVISVETKNYHEADYETSVEFTISHINEITSVFMLEVGRTQIQITHDKSVITNKGYYILPEDNYRKIRNKKRDSKKNYVSTTVEAKFPCVDEYLDYQGLSYLADIHDVGELVEKELLEAWNGEGNGEQILVNANQFRPLFDACFKEQMQTMKRAYADERGLEPDYFWD